MAYHLTPTQKAGIAAADKVCFDNRLPAYYDFVKAAAALCVAIREGKPHKAAHTRLCMVLEGLRNESADSRPAVVPRKVERAIGNKLQARLAGRFSS